MPYFEKMMEHGMMGTRANMSAGAALALLRGNGLDVRADLFIKNAMHGLAANETTLSTLPGVAINSFSGSDSDLQSALRKEVERLNVGEVAMLFIENYHVIAIARDTEGWHVFDTGLNSRSNVYDGATRFAVLSHMASGPTTKSGDNHAHGPEAEALINAYLDSVHWQPVLFRMNRP